MESLFKQFNINIILRYGFPGVYLLIRMMLLKQLNNPSDTSIILCIIGVIFIYPLYKGTYWITIRKLASILGLIPQLKWHKGVVNSLSITPQEKKKYSTLTVCSTCIHICLISLGSKGAKIYKQIELDNTAAHLLYMTSFISIVLLAVDKIIKPLNLNYPIEISVAVVLLIAGVLYDKNIADVRELYLIKDNSTDYTGILKKLISDNEA